MKKTIKRIGIVLLITALLIFGMILYGGLAFQALTVSEYSIDVSLDKPIRIVHFSDLHNKEFGDGNCKLITLVEEQHPDFIIMSGDILNGDDPNTEIVSDLIKALVLIAPVYFGYGNHEYTWEQNYNKDLRKIISAAGATVVNNDYIDVEVKGQLLRIGGYMGYYRQPGMITSDLMKRQKELFFADDFESTDCLKLLINHIPTPWVDWDYVDKYPVDVVFSGHYHGGTIRIPVLNRGVFAPYVGWFPPFSKGIYEGEKAICVLSAGLGNEYHIPRINNPPEVVVVDLIPKNN